MADLDETYPSEEEFTSWMPPVPDALDGVADADMMVCVRAAERLERIEWYRRDVVAEAARHGLGREIAERSARLELACLLRIGEQAAGALMERAEALLGRYRDAFASLSQAAMTPRHAELLVLLLDQVPDDALRHRLIPPAVVLAETEPVGAFRRKLKALIEKEQAPTLPERYAAALTDRRVIVEDATDGMAWTHLYGPAVEARAAFDRATRIAKSIQKSEAAAAVAVGEGAASGGAGAAVQGRSLEQARSLDQLRADVYGDLLVEGVVPAHPKAARGIRAQVVVTVPALSLLSDEFAGASGAEPAVVEGVGPIPIERARELAGQAKEWIRVLTHPETGMVLSVGRDRYKVPKAMRQAVTWRASRCLTPGCGMPASRCEIDHRVEWADGGQTAFTNLNPLCKNHHIIKTVTGWTIAPTAGGGLAWTSPGGRTYTAEPERRLPVFVVTPPPDETQRGESQRGESQPGEPQPGESQHGEPDVSRPVLSPPDVGAPNVSPPDLNRRDVSPPDLNRRDVSPPDLSPPPF